MRWRRVKAEFKSDAAKNKPDQHQGEGDRQRVDNYRIGQRKSAKQARAADTNNDGIIDTRDNAAMIAGKDVELLRRMLAADAILKPTVDASTASVDQVTGALRTLGVQIGPAGTGPGALPSGSANANGRN